MKKYMDFTKLFRDLLGNLDVGRSVVKQFASDNLERMTDNNPSNLLDTEIADTTALLIPLYADLTEAMVDKGMRKGINYVKQMYFMQMKKLVQSTYATVLAKFPKTDERYSEFYPEGLTGIDRANLDNIIIYISTIIKASQKYQADLPPNFAQPFIDLKALFLTYIQKSAAKSSDVSTDKGDLDNEVKAVTEQLTKNMLRIAYLFFKQPEKKNVYFNFMIIDSHTGNPDKPGITIPDTVAPGATKIVYEKIEEDSEITVTNNGTDSFLIGVVLQKTDELTTGLIVGPNQTKTPSVSDLGNPGCKILKIKNLSPTVIGNYVVKIL